MTEAIRRNQAFLDAVIKFQDKSSPFPVNDDDDVAERPSRTSARQVGKVNTTLHQLMRDWSCEGEEERRQSYGVVVEELERLCPVNSDKNQAVKVLVPGAGLGRLTMEIVARGYACAGASVALQDVQPVGCLTRVLPCSARPLCNVHKRSMP